MPKSHEPNNNVRPIFEVGKPSLDHVPCLVEDRSNPIHRRFRNKYLVWLYSQIVANKGHPLTRWHLKSRKMIWTAVEKHIESKNWFIVHPFSNFGLYFSIVITPITFFLFLWLAYTSAFHYDLAQCISCNCLYVDYAIFNTFIFLEILLTFFIGYHTKTEIVLDQGRIAKHYLLTYFIFDILSCMPVTYIQNLLKIHDESPSTHVLHDLALLRIMTAPRFFKFLNITAEYFKLSDIKTRIIRLICFNILCVHFGVCFYKRTYSAFFRDLDSKMGTIMFDPKTSAFEKYLMVTYILTWRVYGDSFGNLTPTMSPQKLLGVLLMVIIISFSIYLLIQILYIMETKNVSRQKYHEIMRQVDHYMCLRQFPLRLQNRVRLFYEKKFMKTYFKEDVILEALSEPLRKDIVLHCGQIFMEKVKLLEGISVPIIKSIVSCLKLEIYLPNDTITKAGDYGFCMYFIGVGSVAIYTKSGKEVCHLEDGDHFGEFCLIFQDKRRKGNVVAIAYCEIYRLDLHDFKRTIETVPVLHKRLETVASRRLDSVLIEEERHKQSWTQNNN